MSIRMKLRTGIAALLWMAFFLTACEDNQICDENTRSFLNAGLYTVRDGEVQDSVPNNIFVLSLGDVSLYWDSANISKIPFPLNHETTTTAYLMVADSVADTIWFNYETDLIFVSYSCGFAPQYTLTSIQHSLNGIDSIKISNDKVESSDEENIRIFL